MSYLRNFRISSILLIVSFTFNKAREKPKKKILDIYYTHNVSYISSCNISSRRPCRAVGLSSIMLTYNGCRCIMTFIAWPADLTAFYVSHG